MVLEQCENHSRNQSADVLVFILGALYMGPHVLLWSTSVHSLPSHHQVSFYDYTSSSSVWPSKKSGLIILKWPKIGGRNPVKKSRPVMRGPNIGSTHYWSWFGARNVGISFFGPRICSFFDARNVGISFLGPRICVTGSGRDGVCVCVCAVCVFSLCIRLPLCVCVQCVCVLILHSVAKSCVQCVCAMCVQCVCSVCVCVLIVHVQ